MGIKRAFPHGEDPGVTAGGDTDVIRRPMARPVPFHAGSPMGNAPGSPPGENKMFLRGSPRRSFVGGDSPHFSQSSDVSLREQTRRSDRFRDPEAPESSQEDDTEDSLENRAAKAGMPEEGKDGDPLKLPVDFLQLIREAEAQSNLYVAQVNRTHWTEALRAFHGEHSTDSKYRRGEYKNRSKLFIPRTRSAVRKDVAAVAASLFNNIDAVSVMPGNESDPKQKASAAVIQELINYRTDRTSTRNSVPWMLVAMGARVDALTMGICISKQSWKLEHKFSGTKIQIKYAEDGEPIGTEPVDIWEIDIDRPDIQLIPPENVVIDPAADWTNPCQTAQYFIIKWPMRIDEVRKCQDDPVNPWNDVDETILLSSVEAGKFDMAAIRRAREEGLDRFDEQQTGYREFRVIWVYEAFIRHDGKDWCFISVGDKAYLTDPKPTEEVYPEQDGDRPLAMGYGSLEPHRIYPMSPVTTWQPYQQELNDIRNLALDGMKQNIIPVTKVVRGTNVDLDQVKKRSHGTTIMVNKADDVTFERPPEISQAVPLMTRAMELELDDLAGQFNGQTAQDNNALSRTLGGLKLVSGAANAVQEFDIRLWITTWAEPALAQIAKLEQWYENDPTILALCGQKAQLFEKHGISQIDDDLLEQEVTLRVSVGLGAGDPMQRLQKFQVASQITAPIIAASPDFQEGKLKINVMAIIEEVFGSAGYKDAGDRFFEKGEQKPNPMGDLQQEEIKSKIELNKQRGKGALMSGIAAIGKVSIGNRELENDNANALLDLHMRATEMGHAHGHRHNESILSAMDTGHRHGHELSKHHHDRQMDHFDREQAQQHHADDLAARTAEAAQSDDGEGGGGASAQPAPAPAEAPSLPSAAPAPPQSEATPATNGAAPPQPPANGGADVAAALQASRPIRFHFIRDPRTNRITDAVPIYADQMRPTPQRSPVGMPPTGFMQ